MMKSQTLCVFDLMPKECGIPQEAKIYSLWFEGYLPVPFATLGVGCNAISILILMGRVFRRSLFNRLIIALVVCDSFVLGKKYEIKN